MTHLIHVGNSLGVRIPKAIINQLGVDEATNLIFKITTEGLLISQVHKGREGWSDAFKTTSKPETLLMGGNIINDFDHDEWEW